MRQSIRKRIQNAREGRDMEVEEGDLNGRMRDSHAITMWLLRNIVNRYKEMREKEAKEKRRNDGKRRREEKKWVAAESFS